MRILSVDDSAATRQFIKKAVDVLGFEFLEAADGREGLEILARENGRIDLILLDRHMPVMDGMAMLEKLKADDRLRVIPVTMVTVEVERAEIQRAIAGGAKNYLIKPFTQENLIGKILEGLNIAP
ncbi:MAG: response regulator [Desulfobulbaceae bacterium]|jgi:two-component system chemotaxis response regulator CheY|nr:response regulator [Desulfobulbaceae bacterium]MDY0350584.1 response regulator [Desulfobulbaceae bacterium]